MQGCELHDEKQEAERNKLVKRILLDACNMTARVYETLPEKEKQQKPLFLILVSLKKSFYAVRLVNSNFRLSKSIDSDDC
jgi:hypothetical protein